MTTKADTLLMLSDVAGGFATLAPTPEQADALKHRSAELLEEAFTEKFGPLSEEEMAMSDDDVLVALLG